MPLDAGSGGGTPRPRSGAGGIPLPAPPIAEMGYDKSDEDQFRKMVRDALEDLSTKMEELSQDVDSIESVVLGEWTRLTDTVTTSSGSAVSVSSLAAYEEYMVMFVIPSGVTALRLRLNNDSSSTYSGDRRLYSTSAGATSGGGGVGFLPLFGSEPVNTHPIVGWAHIVKRSASETAVVEAQFVAHDDASTHAIRSHVVGKWPDTSAVVNRIDLVAGAGTFPVGCRIVVYGRTTP